MARNARDLGNIVGMRMRTAFLIALTFHAVAWLMVLGHQLNLNPRADQIFFGLRISFGLSGALRVIEGAIIVVTLAAMFQIGLRAFAVWLVSDPVVRPGTCVRCGYDMRGSTIQCPECGYVVEKMSTSPVTDCPRMPKRENPCRMQ